LEKECKAIGRDFSNIEKSCWLGGQVLIAANEEELLEKIRQKNVAGLSMEEFKKTAFTGTPQQCREQLKVYVDLGATFFMLYFSDLPSVDGLKLFAEAVMKLIGGG
jgi:alkanesulfonate monooxygenase SsuD/methylene tetrahydromethanopterin reductase-like flavin-dependent oxidoreductase (luciferase family)